MSEISVQAETPSGAAEPGPLHRRIAETFFAPVALFRRFGPNAPWVGAMIFTVVLSAIAMVLVPGEVWVQTVRDAAANDPRMQGVDPESMATMQRFGAIFAVLVFPWIFLFAQSGLLLVIFTMLMGGEATYRQYLAVGAHAAVVGAVGQLAVLPLIISQGNVRANISLGALVSGMEPGFLPSFLGVFNVFLIWQLVLLGLGVAAVNRRSSAAAPLAILFAILAFIAVVVALVTNR